MNRTFEKLDLNNPLHQEASKLIFDWSQASGSMLPVTVESIRTHPHAWLALGPRAVILGHIAVTDIQEGAAKVGALVVNPEFRQTGTGSGLINQLLDDVALLPGVKACQTYANDDSKGLFSRAGGVVIGYRETAGQTGCHWIMSLTGVIQARMAAAACAT